MNLFPCLALPLSLLLSVGTSSPAALSTKPAAKGTGKLQGVWVFSQAPDYPGLRGLQLQVKEGRLVGTLTTDWYGPMPMHDLTVQDGVARFGIHNGNPRVPMKTWTAQIDPDGQLHVVGDLWYEHVDLKARKGTGADASRFAFKVAPLPAWSALKPDGLAQTPPMGWSSWNKFAEKIDDATVRAIADRMVSSGLRDAGYVYVNIDDGWQGTRNANGVLQPNAHFPDMKALADYLHARGLKLGLYSSPGPKTCAGFEGSYGHVEQDARTWAAWGIDYLKYDLCSGEGHFLTEESRKAAYLAMGQALRRTGRPIVYSLCQYGRDQVGTWGREVGGHLWRTTGDITDDYKTMAEIGFDRNGRAEDAGPGGWNDPDMLEVGNGGMSLEAYRTHMSLWAISAAPLIMGHDLRSMSDGVLDLLTNLEVIAIDQDPLGRQGRRVRRLGDLEVWSRPLADGSVALAAFNRGTTSAIVDLQPQDAGLKRIDRARDPWAHQESDFRGGAITVPPHGVFLLRVNGPRAAS